MFKNIDETNRIFLDNKYLKDISIYSVIELIKKNPVLMLSDDLNFIIAMASEKLPVWIWTSDNISEITLDKVCETFISKVKAFNVIKFASKPIIANKILSQFSNNQRTVSIRQCLECKQVIRPENPIDIVRPDINDLMQIAECIKNYEAECYNKIMSLENVIKAAEKSIQNPRFFIIKENDRVVCIGRSAKETEKSTSIEGVYTIPEIRNRGYAAAMVAKISEAIIEQGRTAVLLTDINNLASNKSYKNVGFTECGLLCEVKIYNTLK